MNELGGTGNSMCEGSETEYVDCPYCEGEEEKKCFDGEPCNNCGGSRVIPKQELIDEMKADGKEGYAEDEKLEGK